MEKLIGRARFQGAGPVKFRDGKEEKFMSEMNGPAADPGTPGAGAHIDDDEGELPEAVRAILDECEAKLRGLGFEGRVAYTSQTSDEEPSPTESFKKASDKRWGIGNRNRAADAIDPSKMTRTQRFIAASRARWGY